MRRPDRANPAGLIAQYLDRTTVARLIEGNWWMRAACQSSDPDLFFPVSSTGKSLEQVDEAKAVCARCLVRRQCLAFALCRLGRCTASGVA